MHELPWQWYLSKRSLFQSRCALDSAYRLVLDYENLHRRTCLAGFVRSVAKTRAFLRRKYRPEGVPRITQTVAANSEENSIPREKYLVGKLFAIFKREYHGSARRIFSSDRHCLIFYFYVSAGRWKNGIRTFWYILEAQLRGRGHN